MKKIEQIATLLMKKGIAFEYTATYLTVKESDFKIFEFASYHRETKELILMSWNYKKVEIETALRELKK